MMLNVCLEKGWGGLYHYSVCSFIGSYRKMNISYASFDSNGSPIDWLQSLKQLFINVPYQILVVSLTLMALF